MDGIKTTKRFKFTPTQDLLKAYQRCGDYRAHHSKAAICPEVSAHFCTELRMHLKAYVVADKYFLGDLRELADSGVHNLLFDCWISENFLEAIEPMFKFDCPDESLKTDTVHGLVLCLPQYRSSEQLKTMLDRYPELARIALLSTAKKELVAVEGHRDKYCPDCGGAVEFWPGDESDENRNCDGGTKECVYDRKKPD